MSFGPLSSTVAYEFVTKYVHSLDILFHTINPLMGTLKPQNNGPLYSNNVIGAAVPPRLDVPNVTANPINGQCINFILFDAALY